MSEWSDFYFDLILQLDLEGVKEQKLKPLADQLKKTVLQNIFDEDYLHSIQFFRKLFERRT